MFYFFKRTLNFMAFRAQELCLNAVFAFAFTPRGSRCEKSFNSSNCLLFIHLSCYSACKSADPHGYRLLDPQLL